MNEIWKDVYFIKNNIEYDYRGFYQISNKGRIKSLERYDKIGRTIKERILQSIKDNRGYLTVNLYKNGKRKFFQIHRLV